MPNPDSATVMSRDYQSAIDRMALASALDSMQHPKGMYTSEQLENTLKEILPHHKEIALVMLQALLMGEK